VAQHLIVNVVSELLGKTHPRGFTAAASDGSNMTHQKLTAKFPTESVAKICRRWQRRYKAEGIRPHPRQTRRKEAACACGWLKLTASCRQRNEKWQLKLKNCRAWSERAAAALAKATTAAEFLEAREQADIAYNAAKLAARAGNRASAKEERTALTMSEPAINAGM
jgi:hypothetical protein